MIIATILSVNAKDFGVFGETFQIQEKSLLEVIKTKLLALGESGQLESHQKTILSEAKKKIKHPEPVKGLSKANTPRSFTYDPSITVPYDLKDHEGRVFHKHGTRVNPLDTRSLRCPLLFVDGDDLEQVSWAIQEFKKADEAHKPKIILVKGSPFNLTEQLQLPVYFDQAGSLIKKLGIKQVPARVQQQEKALIIQELASEELTKKVTFTHDKN